MLRAEAGIDYLTCTLPYGDPQGAKFIRIGQQLQEGEQNEGNTFKAASSQGYVGSICGSVFVGEGTQGSMVRCSGFSAQEAVQALKVVQKRITRIDLQVTVWYEEDPYAIIRNYYERAYADASVADKRARREVTRHEKIDGGYTVAIGARTSNYYGRLYDKWRESKDDAYANALRYEVEIKGERAEQAYNALKFGKKPKEKQIASFVGEWYAARGIRVPFLYQVGEMDLTPIRRETSDTKRRLKWLKTQVRHTVSLLRDVVDDTVILEALGFLEPVSSGVPLTQVMRESEKT